MALRTKLYLVAAIPAILSALTFGLSTTVSDGDAAFLYRLGLTFAIAGFLFCLVTWDLHRVAELQQNVTFLEARLGAAERRGDDAIAMIEDLRTRMAAIEDDLECRRLVKRIWNQEDDERIQSLLHPEDN